MINEDSYQIYPNQEDKDFIACGITSIVNSNRRMPHKITDVIRNIETHRNFNGLSHMILLQYEESVSPFMRKRKTTDNAYIRQLWRHLYHGHEID